MDLIIKIQEQPYWADLSILQAEQLRIDLRDLIKFIDKEQGQIVYTNFEDEVGDNIKEVDLLYGSNNLEAYKKKVKQFIQSKKDNITIARLRNNIP